MQGCKMNYKTVVDQICHCMVSEKKLHQPTFLPLANEVWGKVTFLQMSVCPQGGGPPCASGSGEMSTAGSRSVCLWVWGCASGSRGVCVHTKWTHIHTPWTHTIGHTPWTYTPRSPLDTPQTVHKWALGHPTGMLSCFHKDETTSYLCHFPRPHFLN